MIFVNSLATSVPGRVDEDGDIKWEPDNKILWQLRAGDPLAGVPPVLRWHHHRHHRRPHDDRVGDPQSGRRIAYPCAHIPIAGSLVIGEECSLCAERISLNYHLNDKARKHRYNVNIFSTSVMKCVTS